MKFRTVVVLVFFSVSVISFGQTNATDSNLEFEKNVPEFVQDRIVVYALKNIQQEGNFFFLPILPPDHFGKDSLWSLWQRQGLIRNQMSKYRAPLMQTILKVLDAFEKKSFEINGSPEIIRSSDDARPYEMAEIHGILVRATPKPKLPAEKVPTK